MRGSSENPSGETAPAISRLPIFPAIVAWILVWFTCPSITPGDPDIVWGILSAVIWGIVWIYWRINADRPTPVKQFCFRFGLPIFFILLYPLNLALITPMVMVIARAMRWV